MNLAFQNAQVELQQLRKTPGFAAMVVIALGFGIGANTAIFSLIYAALLPP